MEDPQQPLYAALDNLIKHSENLSYHDLVMSVLSLLDKPHPLIGYHYFNTNRLRSELALRAEEYFAHATYEQQTQIINWTNKQVVDGAVLANNSFVPRALLRLIQPLYPLVAEALTEGDEIPLSNCPQILLSCQLILMLKEDAKITWEELSPRLLHAYLEIDPFKLPNTSRKSLGEDYFSLVLNQPFKVLFENYKKKHPTGTISVFWQK